MAKSTGTTKKSPAPERQAPATTGPERDAIARRAYEIYQARGGSHGSDVEDWLQAERELSPPKGRR